MNVCKCCSVGRSYHMFQPIHSVGTEVHQKCLACFDKIVRSSDKKLFVYCDSCAKFVPVDPRNAARIANMFDKNVFKSKLNATEIENLAAQGLSFEAMQLSQ